MTKRSTAKREPLSKRFPGEYNSWKAMKQRLKKQGRELHPKFRTFDQFFSIMGEKADPEETLDRKDHKNPDYSPQNVRWASKSLQSRNRKSTTLWTYTGRKYADKKGLELSLTEWAEVTQQNASTMRGRKKAGWKPDEIIDGKRAREPKTFEQMSMRELLDYEPWDPDRAIAQETHYRTNSHENEDRFEFMLNHIRLVHFERLYQRFKSTAYFMPDEKDRDAYESAFGNFDAVDGDWGRKPNASQKDWEALLAAYAAHISKYGEMRKRYAKWKKALAAADAAQRAGPEAAKRKRQELMKRYTSDSPRKASPSFDDDDD